MLTKIMHFIPFFQLIFYLYSLSDGFFDNFIAIKIIKILSFLGTNFVTLLPTQEAVIRQNLVIRQKLDLCLD